MDHRPRKKINPAYLGVGTAIMALFVFVTQASIVQAQSTRLDAAKLRVCQNREAAINRITSRMASRASHQVIVFSTIAQRVENFYARTGQTIATYDALVADVNAKKSAAQKQAATLTTSAPFSCSADDPHGLASIFKDNLRTTQTALQDYKTAVKNLIVGVRSAQGQASSNQNVNAANTNSL